MTTDKLAELRARVEHLRSTVAVASDELALLQEEAELLEKDRDNKIDRMFASIMNAAREGERAGVGVRPGLYRFGDGSLRSGVVFRQPTPARFKQIMALPEGDAIEAENKKALAECVLWWGPEAEVPEKPEEKIRTFDTWIRERSAAYPNLHSDVTVAWLRHNSSAREATRGKA